jgi:hypothetical protein
MGALLVWLAIATAGATAAPGSAAAPGTAAGTADARLTAGTGTVEQKTGTVEALDPRAAEAERRQKIQAFLAVAGIVGLFAAYLAWRRIRALSPEFVVLAVEGLPAAAAPGETLRPRVQVTARAPLEHAGLRTSLLLRAYRGPRPKKKRFTEREVEGRALLPAGAIAAGESRAAEGPLALPADADESFDHAFGVDLPPGREAIVHWVVRASLRVGDAEVLAEEIVPVRRATGAPTAPADTTGAAGSGSGSAVVE